ncbi:MAG: isochorismate synthase MenF [Halobacteriaceae archaeon]
MAHGDGRETAPLLARSRRVTALPRDARTPAFRAAVAAEDAPLVAWTDPGGPTIVGSGAATTLSATGPERFETLRDGADALFDRLDFDGPSLARPRLLGGAAFDEPAPGDPWAGFPSAYLLLPRIQVVSHDGETWLTLVESTETGDEGDRPDAALDLETTAAALEEVADRRREATAGGEGDGHRGPGIDAVTHDPPRSDWEADVAAAVERIEEGDLEKVVLAGALVADLSGPLDVHDVLDRLGERYPDCYRFAVDPGTGPRFFGATPELLVERDGRAVRTTALAGSAERAADPERDRALAAALRDSEKRRREHALVVEAVRDRLAPHLESVEVGERSVRTLATVQHLQTPVRGELAGETHALGLADALHPTPAVGGLPPDEARAVIRDTERFDRGWYAGPVGWVDAEGDGSFAVAIRSALAHDERATLFAGNGIVADADPAEEWAELQLKYRPVLDELG